ncbi:hypothetical protein CEXT_431091 [Caerostris extrusa]|uniref:Uncharacterized protein n=1 Tax=Caerostris extrusa TaxID=172846 RepID=A0AAV4TB31_CAEEX|nr:hypothetical protein CEXT_431091 [Caerostris extrusa]
MQKAGSVTPQEERPSFRHLTCRAVEPSSAGTVRRLRPRLLSGQTSRVYFILSLNDCSRGCSAVKSFLQTFLLLFRLGLTGFETRSYFEICLLLNKIFNRLLM